jgi:adenylate cyclase
MGVLQSIGRKGTKAARRAHTHRAAHECARCNLATTRRPSHLVAPHEASARYVVKLCSPKVETGAQEVTAPSEDAAELSAETVTIAFVDLVESVKHVVRDETIAIRQIRQLLLDVSSTTTECANARLIERRGDGLLLRFENGVDAVRGGSRALFACRRFNEVHGTEYALRIGIHTAQLFADGEAFYGVGINVAARVVSLANPGEIYATAAIVDQIVPNLHACVEEIGECYLKHIDAPVRVYQLREVAHPMAVGVIRAMAPEAIETALPSVAVLPFEIDRASETQGAAALLGESLVHTLARSSNIQVTSWMSTRSIDTTSVALSEIAASLDAQWLVRGTIAMLDDRVSGWYEVVDAKGKTPWSDRFVGDVRDLLARESETANSIAESILNAITEAEARKVAKHALPTLQSHSLLMGAVGLMHRSSRQNFSTVSCMPLAARLMLSIRSIRRGGDLCFDNTYSKGKPVQRRKR